MTYSNKFVMAVFINGQPSKELANGVVPVEFGAEYSLRFRNKNNRRAVVKIFVDGENVSGPGYIIPANNHIDVKRHWENDRAFKFVSLDSPDAVEAGKNGPNPDKEKGLIEAHFYLEKEHTHYYPWWPYKEEHHHHHHHHHDHYHPRPWNPYPIRPVWYGGNSPDQQWGSDVKVSFADSGNVAGGADPTFSVSGLESATRPGAQPESTTSFHSPTCNRGNFGTTSSNCSLGGQRVNSQPVNEMVAKGPELSDGCTVEGQTTGQRFSTSYIELEDSYTTLKVFLQGYNEDVIQQAATDEPKKRRKTNKDSQIEDLEAENERLRRELAEIENEKLKKRLKRAKKE